MTRLMRQPHATPCRSGHPLAVLCSSAACVAEWLCSVGPAHIFALFVLVSLLRNISPSPSPSPSLRRRQTRFTFAAIVFVSRLPFSFNHTRSTLVYLPLDLHFLPLPFNTSTSSQNTLNKPLETRKQHAVHSSCRNGCAPVCPQLGQWTDLH